MILIDNMYPVPHMVLIRNGEEGFFSIFPTQFGNMNIHAAVISHKVSTLGHVGNLLPAEHCVRVFHQHLQDIEFRGG